MLSRLAISATTKSAAAFPTTSRALLASNVPKRFITIGEVTADDALKVSGYKGMDYTINEDVTVFDAVKKLSGHNVGCLVTIDDDGNMTGVLSERDYITKIALLGRTSKDTLVKEISTKSNELVTAAEDESVEDCMSKMLAKDIRHLPIVGNEGVVGMVSIKDLVKAVVGEKDTEIRSISETVFGKAAVEE